MDKDTARQWLIDFMTEINGQDNRCTATPYYYELRSENSVVTNGGSIFFTAKAANEYIRCNKHNLPYGVYVYLQWGARNPEMKNMLEAIGQVVGIPYQNK